MTEYRGVVLITVDSLRADHLGYHGYEKDTSPFLDEFASENTSFKNCTSAGPRTLSSFPCLLSSTYLSSHPFGKERSERLSEDRVLISEYLEDVETSAFHSNPLISKYYGYDRGFDRFEDYLITDSTVNAGYLGRAKRILKLLLGDPPFTPGGNIHEDALEWIRSREGKFFSWIHYMEPHMPYLPPKRYQKLVGGRKVGHLKKLLLGKKLDNTNTRSDLSDDEVDLLIQLYDACIRYLDDIIKELIERLPDDVSVIITADHGEGFREHGFLGHKDYLYDEVIHVPLFVSGDEQDVETPVNHVDVVPTVLRMLGKDVPDFYLGENLFDLPDREGTFTEWLRGEKWQIAYRGRDFKYILDKKRDKEEFYDLENDPSEAENIASEMDIERYRKTVLDHRQEQIEMKSKSEKKKIKDTIGNISL
ncbi:MAG: sulfatase [Thermoplasmata archaeon]